MQRFSMRTSSRCRSPPHRDGNADQHVNHRDRMSGKKWPRRAIQWRHQGRHNQSIGNSTMNQGKSHSPFSESQKADPSPPATDPPSEDTRRPEQDREYIGERMSVDSLAAAVAELSNDEREDLGRLLIHRHGCKPAPCDSPHEAADLRKLSKAIRAGATHNTALFVCNLGGRVSIQNAVPIPSYVSHLNASEVLRRYTVATAHVRDQWEQIAIASPALIELVTEHDPVGAICSAIRKLSEDDFATLAGVVKDQCGIAIAPRTCPVPEGLDAGRAAMALQWINELKDADQCAVIEAARCLAKGTAAAFREFENRLDRLRGSSDEASETERNDVGASTDDSAGTNNAPDAFLKSPPCLRAREIIRDSIPCYEAREILKIAEGAHPNIGRRPFRVAIEWESEEDWYDCVAEASISLNDNELVALAGRIAKAISPKMSTVTPPAGAADVTERTNEPLGEGHSEGDAAADSDDEPDFAQAISEARKILTFPASPPALLDPARFLQESPSTYGRRLFSVVLQSWGEFDQDIQEVSSGLVWLEPAGVICVAEDIRNTVLGLNLSFNGEKIYDDFYSQGISGIASHFGLEEADDARRLEIGRDFGTDSKEWDAQCFYPRQFGATLLKKAVETGALDHLPARWALDFNSPTLKPAVIAFGKARPDIVAECKRIACHWSDYTMAYTRSHESIEQDSGTISIDNQGGSEGDGDK